MRFNIGAHRGDTNCSVPGDEWPDFADRVLTDSDSGFTPLFGPNSNGLFDRHYKNFSVTNLPGSRCCDDGFNCFLNSIVAHHDLKLYLRKKIDGVLAAAIDFCVTLLAPKAFYLTDGHSCDSDFR